MVQGTDGWMMGLRKEFSKFISGNRVKRRGVLHVVIDMVYSILYIIASILFLNLLTILEAVENKVVVKVGFFFDEDWMRGY